MKYVFVVFLMSTLATSWSDTQEYIELPIGAPIISVIKKLREF